MKLLQAIDTLSTSGDGGIPVGVLLWTVFEAIVEVFILCLAGYILARVGIADKATQRKMNVINVSLFTPSLLFGKVAFSLTPDKLKEMWVIPLGFVIVTGVSAGIAWTLGTIFKLKRSQRSFAMCAAMFQNSNSLPIALIQSLVIEVPGLKWDSSDTKDAMLGRALTYLVLYSTLGMMLRWSYGVQLLSQADDPEPTTKSSTAPDSLAIHSPPNGSNNILTSEPSGFSIESPSALGENEPLFSSMDAIAEDDTSNGNGGRKTTGPNGHNISGLTLRSQSGLAKVGRSGSSSSRRPPTRTESGREFWGLPEAAKSRRSLSDQGEEEEESGDEVLEDEEWGDLPNSSTQSRRRLQSRTKFKLYLHAFSHKCKHFLGKVNQFMTVPMYSALLSITIAMIPPLQALLIKSKPVTEAIRGAGQCSIPMTLVVLGAFFYSPPPTTPPPPPVASSTPQPSFLERKLQALRHPQASKSNPGENRAVFVAVASRMILTPLVLLPFLALIAREDYFEAAEDPVFILAATLIISSPPALTLAQITQAASGDAFERLISKTITWSYAILTPPLTLLYVVMGLLFGRL